MKQILIVTQIIISVILIVTILLQNQGSGVSGIFGGSGGGAYRTKRGMEKILFYLTIVFTILFLGISLAILLV